MQTKSNDRHLPKKRIAMFSLKLKTCFYRLFIKTLGGLAPVALKVSLETHLSPLVAEKTTSYHQHE